MFEFYLPRNVGFGFEIIDSMFSVGQKLLRLKLEKCSPKIALCLFSDVNNGNMKINKQYKEIGSNILEKIVEAAPKHYQPYMKLMRLDRPIGTWLLYLPCTWGIAMATPFDEVVSLYMLGLFGIGATLMRGAGCTINDMWDRNFDRYVDRTKTRPIASGAVTLPHALMFVLGQMSLSLIILLQFNWYSVVLGLASTGLVISYPLFKRITYWPQVVLGCTLNWGVLVGYSAIAGHCDLSICLPAYISGILWTIIYDTGYGYQDIEDDKLLKLKSTAIYFGDKGKQWMSGFATGMGFLLTLTGYNYGAGPIFYGGITAAMMHIAYQLYVLDIKDRMDCLKWFKSNRTTGLIIFLSIALDRGLHSLTLLS